MIGRTLGHYEITSQLGKGGMGEVYQAKDQVLGRDVAIKVLPHEFARDADRVARFQREAKLLASLNHQNIAAIYGLEESAGTNFLVLELVEGTTLADQVKCGPISVEDSLKLALQIAEALEAAHEKGIIHRDLKPANIKVTPVSKVKVLDFGLAKAFTGEEADLNLSNSPTLSNIATMQGMILGTAAYMSPEQARGKAVDKRTDIWAFGCVLFEMLTGSAAFSGKDATDILAAVIRSEPDLEKAPAKLRPLLRRCLQKDPNKRLRDIGDVKLELEEFLANPNEVSAQPVAVTEPRTRLRRLFLWIAAVAILGVIAGGVAVWNYKPTATGEVLRLVHEMPEGQQFANQMWAFVTISPDGRQYAYSTTEGLFLRSMGEWDARLVSNANENTAVPCFSPDRHWVGYWSMTDSKMKKVSVSGGSPQTLCDTDPSAQVLDAGWSEDDRIVYSQSGKGILSISSSGGIPEALIPNEKEMLYSPRLLPDGKTVIYTLGSDPYQVVAQSIRSNQRKVLFAAGDTARYLPTGHIVYALDYSLYAAPFDLNTLQAGKPVQVVDGLFRVGHQYMPQYSISSSGALLYVPKAATAATLGRTLVWVDRHGNEEPIETQPNLYGSLRISPDGTRVALSAEIDGNTDIWILDLARNNTLRRLTFDKGADGIPLWSRDGQRIAFSSNRQSGISVYWKAADGTGKDEAVAGTAVPATATYPLSWSRDGKTLVLMENFTTAGVYDYGIGALVIEGDRKYKPLLKEKYHEFQPQISPNGRWMAYVSNESGQAQIYVRPFPDVDSGRWQVSTTGGNSPLWSRDGQELFYRNGNAAIAVAVKTEPSFDIVGTPQPLFRGAYLSQPRRLVNAALQPYLWDVSPDGKRFLMMKEAGTTASTRINIVLNWFEELKQRVPKM
ncbi:MAG: serine/threonine-protein kinase [Acidobacteria bacterium]|nr:serine/threonine-protein kinase [Acidobacteriota bacterium]